VAACRGFLGEGIIVPIQSTSTALVAFLFASRFGSALLASFQWSAWGHRRQIGRSQGQQIGTLWSWAFSGAEDEQTEILRSGSGTQTRCCRPLARFLPSGPGSESSEPNTMQR
jgi:hypothetical protein